MIIDIILLTFGILLVMGLTCILACLMLKSSHLYPDDDEQEHINPTDYHQNDSSNTHMEQSND